MRRLTYSNSRGEQISFYLSPFLITSLTGIGEVDANVQGQQAPYQDGDTYIDTILQPRFIELEAVITDADLKVIKDYRRQISKICNPKLGLGKITLELDGDLKEIKGTLDGGVVFPERGQDVWQKFMITWKCPNPYWKTVYESSESMAFLLGGLSFPLRLGTSFSSRGFRKTISNEGDVPTPISIEFIGPAINPVVQNLTTGEFVRVNRTLDDGEKLIINTEFGNKSVEMIDNEGNRTNVFNWIDLESSFWNLINGDNLVEYRSEDDNTKARVKITFKNRYVGI